MKKIDIIKNKLEADGLETYKKTELIEIIVSVIEYTEMIEKMLDQQRETTNQARQIATKFEQNNAAMYEQITQIWWAYKEVINLTEWALLNGNRAVRMLLDRFEKTAETKNQLMEPDGSGAVPKLTNDPMDYDWASIDDIFSRE